MSLVYSSGECRDARGSYFDLTEGLYSVSRARGNLLNAFFRLNAICVKLARSTRDVAKSEFASKRFGDSTQAPRCRLPKYFDMTLIDRSDIIDTPAYDDLNCKRKGQPQRDEDRDGNDQQQVIEIQRSTHLPKEVHHCHAPLPAHGNSKGNTKRARWR